jgi:cytochrome P450
MQAPPAERPLDLLRIAGELKYELRRRHESLPPGELGFSLKQTRRFQRDPLNSGLEFYGRFGPIFTTRMLHRPIVTMVGAEANHFVTVAGADHFSWRRGMFGEELIPLLGDGLITSDGEYHDRARRIAMPAFHRRRMDSAVDVMAEETERALRAWRPGDVVDVYGWVRDLAMSIAMRALVGLDPKDGGHEMAECFERALAYTNADVWKLPLRGPHTPWARLQAERAKLDEMILSEVARRRQEPPGERDDVLSMLLEARDEDGSRFTDAELRDQVVTFLFGGHDTSSSSISFLLYELARNPDVLDRIQSEEAGVLAGATPTVDQLTTDLPELNQAVDETLRLYPPVWFGPRLAVSDFEFAGHRVPAGTHVNYSSWITHHLPELFESPREFRPDRFAPEARKQLPKGAYLPFGGGSRICIGKRFGQLMVKAVATTLLQRVRLDVRRGDSLSVGLTPTLSPAPGLPMVVGGAPPD